MGAAVRRMIQRRAVVFVPTLVLTSIIVFSLRLIIPGGVAESILGDHATPEAVADFNAKFGLDHPLPAQYLEWITGVVRGDFGTSYATGLPVSDVVGPRVASTVEIVLLGLLVSILVGGFLGMVSAVRRSSPSGRIVFAASAIGVSVPVFWASTVCAGLLGAQLGWLPANGRVPVSEGLVPHLKSIAMPAILIALPTTALVARQLRSGMVRALESPYVRTARAVGIPAKRIYFDLALRNAVEPVVSFMPVAIAALVGESIVIDQVFALPGLGSAITSSVVTRDYSTLQAIVLILAVTVLIATLLADVALTAMDPRRRKEIR